MSWTKSFPPWLRPVAQLHCGLMKECSSDGFTSARQTKELLSCLILQNTNGFTHNVTSSLNCGYTVHNCRISYLYIYCKSTNTWLSKIWSNFTCCCKRIEFLCSFLGHYVDIVLFVISGPSFSCFLAVFPPQHLPFPSITVFFCFVLFVFLRDYTQKRISFIQLENLWCPPRDSKTFPCHLLLLDCSVWILHHLTYRIAEFGSEQLIYSLL